MSTSLLYKMGVWYVYVTLHRGPTAERMIQCAWLESEALLAIRVQGSQRKTSTATFRGHQPLVQTVLPVLPLLVVLYCVILISVIIMGTLQAALNATL